MLLLHLADRLRELELYLAFLENADKRFTRFITGSSRIVDYGSDERKILRAMFFLIFYNVVESMFRQAFIGTYEEAVTRGTTYAEFVDSWQRLVVKEQIATLFKQQVGPGPHYDKTTEMVRLVSRGNPIPLDSISISGNVDQRLIAEWCKKHGVKFRSAPSCRAGTDLEIVKTLRNDLAHGSLSFSDVGKDYLATDLRRMKRRGALYLTGFARAIENYRLAERYKV